MIIRIMGEGQFQVGEEDLARLNRLDEELLAALEVGDESSFRRALHALLHEIRVAGTPLADDSLEPSDLILPDQDASLEQVKELLLSDGEGIIPGFPG